MIESSQLRGLAPIALAAAVAPALSAQTLVKDINPSPPADLGGSDPSDIAFAGGLAFFVAEGVETGRELFVSDGTPEGSSIVVDLLEGPASSLPRQLTGVGSLMFFLANDDLDSDVLYRSDGTPSGTFPLASNQPFYGATDLAASNGRLYFLASSTPPVQGYFDYQVWVSDGTTGGTAPLAWEPFTAPTIWGADESYLYFELLPGQLWRTTGTVAGTELIFDGGDVRHFAHGGGTLWFTELHGQVGVDPTWDLWTSDGSPGGATLVEELGYFKLSIFAANDTHLFFTGKNVAPGPWVSDGTAAGTYPLLDVGPGGIFSVLSYSPLDGTSFVFSGNEGSGYGLWYTDGTPQNTYELAHNAPSGLTAVGSEVYFRASPTTGSSSNFELWRTDGTPVGTMLVADLNQSGDSDPSWLTSDGSKLWFTADADAVGSELFTADAGGVELAADLVPNEVSASSSFAFVDKLHDQLIFIAEDGTGLGLWASDGTEAGTTKLTPVGVFPENIDEAVQSHAHFDGWLFISFDGVLGTQLWRTDGTPEGTAEVYPSFNEAYNIHASNGKLYMAAAEPPFGVEPYVLDDPSATPRLLKDIGSLHSDPWRFFTFGDKTVFVAESDAEGHELWITDGTEAGTILLADIHPGPEDSSPAAFTVVGDTLFFTAESALFERQIWSTDGTPAGTQMRLDVAPLGLSNPNGLVADDGWIYFRTNLGGEALAYHPETETSFSLLVEDAANFLPFNGRLLLEQDGEVLLSWAGVPGVFETLANASSIRVQGAGDKLFVQAGNELFLSDGTTAGTTFVAELAPSELVGDHTDLHVSAIGSDERVLAQGYDPGAGFEVWLSDGTAAGTGPLIDVQPGDDSSSPIDFFRVGNRVFFAADDGLVGRELHAVPLTSTGGWVAEAFGSTCPMTTGETPRIASTGPAVLGNLDYTVDYSGAPAGSGALLVWSPTPASLPLGGGCALYFGSPFFLNPGVATTDLDGNGSLAAPVPNDLGLLGVVVSFQYLVSDPGGVLLGAVAPTDGLEVVFGM